MTGSTPSHSPPSFAEKLTELHLLGRFQSGVPSLDDWLIRYALLNQRSDSAQTYVVHREGNVVGYYSLAAGAVSREETPIRVAKGLAKHPIGVILLARLAVDKREQGKGLGNALLKDALKRIEGAADTIGARAVVVHAIDEKARRFYEHYGFVPSLFDPFKLMLLMKDLRAQIRRI